MVDLKSFYRVFPCLLRWLRVHDGILSLTWDWQNSQAGFFRESSMVAPVMSQEWLVSGCGKHINGRQNGRNAMNEATDEESEEGH